MNFIAPETANNKIVIIGGGHVGVSLFCDFFVRLQDGSDRARLLYIRDEAVGRWNSDTELTFNDLFQGTSHRIVAEGSSFDSVYSTQAVEWLNAAQHILITVPDIPYVRPGILNHLLENVDMRGKVLVLCRAGQGGAPFMAGRIRADRRLHDSDIVMIEDAFYGTRFIDNTVDCKRKYRINVGIASRNITRAVTRMQEIFPPGTSSELPSWPHFDVQPLASVLFDPLGYIIHVGVTLCDRNIERTRRGEVYTHYIDGIDRELAAQLAQLDAERVEIAAAFGVDAPSFPQTIARQYKKPLLPDFYEMMQSCRDIYKSKSPASLDELISSRSIAEDVPALFTMLQLADVAGCEVPATRRHLDDVRAKISVLGIDEGLLTSYAAAVPREATVSSIIDLLNYPIPGTSPAMPAIATAR